MDEYEEFFRVRHGILTHEEEGPSLVIIGIHLYVCGGRGVKQLLFYNNSSCIVRLV